MRRSVVVVVVVVVVVYGASVTREFRYNESGVGNGEQWRALARLAGIKV